MIIFFQQETKQEVKDQQQVVVELEEQTGKEQESQVQHNKL
jgi:hypothetical protein